MEFKYHPIVENLKVNEDGSQVIFNGKPLKHYETGKSLVVIIKSNNVSLLKLICECWNGLADSPEFIAVKIDETKGNHYTNLKWSKRGQGVSVKRSDSWQKKPLKFPTKQDLIAFTNSKPQNMSMTNYLKENNVSSYAYYIARKKYDKEDKTSI